MFLFITKVACLLNRFVKKNLKMQALRARRETLGPAQRLQEPTPSAYLNKFKNKI